MKHVSVAGVLVGGIVDIVATNIAAIPIVIIAIARVGSNTPREQLTAALASTLRSDPLLFIAAFVVGSACSILGGYVAARIAKRAEVLNGVLSAWLCVGIGVYSVAAGKSNGPVWLIILGFTLSPAMGALGGRLGIRKLVPAQVPA